MEIRVRTFVPELARTSRTAARAAPQLTNANWFKRRDDAEHVVTPVSESPKVSRGYQSCVGIAAVGIDKKTKKPISVLSHQATSTVQPSTEKRLFEEAMARRLGELRERAEPGTIRASVFGGRGHLDVVGMNRMYNNPYPEMRDQAVNIIERTLGRVPIEVVPPSNHFNGSQYAALNTKRQRLHIFKPIQNNQ